MNAIHKDMRLCPLAMIADSIEGASGNNSRDLEQRMGCMFYDCAWYIPELDRCAVNLMARATAIGKPMPRNLFGQEADGA